MAAPSPLEPRVGGRKLGAQALHPLPLNRWPDVELGPGKQLAGHVHVYSEFLSLNPVQERRCRRGPATAAPAQEIHEEGGVDMHPSATISSTPPAALATLPDPSPQ
jgi:hypothetical protein